MQTSFTHLGISSRRHIQTSTSHKMKSIHAMNSCESTSEQHLFSIAAIMAKKGHKNEGKMIHFFSIWRYGDLRDLSDLSDLRDLRVLRDLRDPSNLSDLRDMRI